MFFCLWVNAQALEWEPPWSGEEAPGQPWVQLGEPATGQHTGLQAVKLSSSFNVQQQKGRDLGGQEEEVGMERSRGHGVQTMADPGPLTLWMPPASQVKEGLTACAATASPGHGRTQECHRHQEGAWQTHTWPLLFTPQRWGRCP